VISAESIERVKAAARLSVVVGERVSLRRQGGNLVGLCPFHGEKSPSFHVHDEDGFYHCFGCGVSGNAVTFVMETEGLPFPKAIEALAERFEVTLEYTDKRRSSASENDKKPALYRVTSLAFEFFRAALQSAPLDIKSYVRSRGISENDQAEFGIGFAPLQWQALSNHLRAAGVSEADMIAAGVAARSPKGDLYDVFRGRLIIPVFVDGKKIAGFGGRIIPGLEPEDPNKKSAKYINSKETALYKKSQVLYGLPQALASVRSEKRVFIVEGYLDVIGMHAAGMKNVVATCGTAITEQHVKRLASMVREVMVLFDGDNAGRAAAGKSFEVFVNSGVDAAALFLPEGEDPDTFARTNGAKTNDSLQAMRQESLFDCYIDYKARELGVDRVEQLGAAAKGKLAEVLATMLKSVESAVERDALKLKMSHRLIIEPRLVDDLLLGRKSERPLHKRPSIATEAEVKTSDGGDAALSQRVQRVSALSPVSRDILRAVMVLKEEVGNDLLTLPEISLLDPSAQVFIYQFMNCLRENSSASAAKSQVRDLLTEFGSDWIELWKSAFAMAEDKTVNYQRVFTECIRSLQVQSLRIALQKNRERIGRCDPEDVATFVQTNIDLERKLRDLVSRA
jgi:DNA primase